MLNLYENFSLIRIKLGKNVDYHSKTSEKFNIILKGFSNKSIQTESRFQSLNPSILNELFVNIVLRISTLDASLE